MIHAKHRTPVRRAAGIRPWAARAAALGLALVVGTVTSSIAFSQTPADDFTLGSRLVTDDFARQLVGSWVRRRPAESTRSLRPSISRPTAPRVPQRRRDPGLL